MLAKEITFENFEGEEVTNTYYFNLTKAELAEWSQEDGGLAERLKSIVAERDGRLIIKYFKDIILKAYGARTEDGRFIKNQEERDIFASTPAFSELFMEISQDADKATAFIRAVTPKEFASALDEASGVENKGTPQDHKPKKD